MRDLNSYTVSGRIGGEIKLFRKSEKSKTCCKFSLARNNGQDKEPTWLSITAFGGMAIWLAENRGKGDHIMLHNARIEDATVSKTGNIHINVIVGDFPLTLKQAKRSEEAEIEEFSEPDDFEAEYPHEEVDEGKASAPFAPATTTEDDDDF